MKKILFQGDSITDAGRSREDLTNLGEGYPVFIASSLGVDEPEEYEFVNRGCSGNRIVDIYSRIKMDIVNLKPDVMSILIGVNDVWHEVIRQNGVDADKYFKIYCMLIEEIKAELPDIQIMIMEPFVLKASATEGAWDYFDTEVKLRAEKAKEIAAKYNLKYIPLQEKFEAVTKNCPVEYWLKDGVHPTAFGHELIKREWIKAFKDL